jgi:CheY-like chemotaxis protein
VAYSLKVLVADDHEVHRLLLAKIFESFGCSVTAVCDGIEALAVAAEGFDLVCLDRHMPNLSGDKAAELIGPGPYLVCCTSDVEGLSDVFDMVLTKPISCAAVLDAIHESELLLHFGREPAVPAPPPAMADPATGSDPKRSWSL